MFYLYYYKSFALYDVLVVHTYLGLKPKGLLFHEQYNLLACIELTERLYVVVVVAVVEVVLVVVLVVAGYCYWFVMLRLYFAYVCCVSHSLYLYPSCSNFYADGTILKSVVKVFVGT